MGRMLDSAGGLRALRAACLPPEEAARLPADWGQRVASLREAQARAACAGLLAEVTTEDARAVDAEDEAEWGRALADLGPGSDAELVTLSRAEAVRRAGEVSAGLLQLASVRGRAELRRARVRRAGEFARDSLLDVEEAARSLARALVE